MTHWLQEKLLNYGLTIAYTSSNDSWSDVVKARPCSGAELFAKLVELSLVPSNTDWSTLDRWVKGQWGSVVHELRYYDTCPHCGFDHCEADWVHNGVALVQCGPFHCDGCGATEMGPEVRDASKLSEEERATGWYKSSNAHMTCAPTVGGVLVGDHRVAKVLYAAGLLDPPKDTAGTTSKVGCEVDEGDGEWCTIHDAAEELLF